MKMNKKGFTLIEMLVVIAIIAVLVSIVIPTVSTATEKAAEAADAANIRSAIAELTTNVLSNGGTKNADGTFTYPTKDVTIKQNTAGYVSDITTIGGLNTAGFNVVSGATKGQVIVISWVPATGTDVATCTAAVKTN